MRFSHLFLMYAKRTVCVRSLVPPFRYFEIKNQKCGLVQCQLSTCAPLNMRPYRDDSSTDEDLDYDYISTLKQEGYARDLLYKNTKDILLNRIYSCVSVQELFNVLERNSHYYRCEDVTQTVFVLYDLMRIFCDVAVANRKSLTEAKAEFLNNLLVNSSFQKLLQIAEGKIHDFDSNTLSFCLLYLTKLGLDIGTKPVQLLNEIIRKKLVNEFKISPTSRYLETIFEEVNLRSYFMSQELIPLVINEIDRCESPLALHDLTVSLNKLYRVVTDETLDKYKEKVEIFIQNGFLTSSNYKVVLQIIAFLNYPKWREKNSVLISKCVLLIKNNLSDLNMNEIIMLYETFFKIQEPGEILSSLQRCSSKFFHQLDETPTAQKLTLFSIIIYFASPNLRSDFQKILKKYVQECNDYDNLMILRKLLSHVKVTDEKLCNLFWDKVLKFVKTQNLDVIKLTQNYINFSNDTGNYRHPKFEAEVLSLMSGLVKEANYDFFPQKLSNFLSFVLLYGEDHNLLQHLVAKLEASWGQLRYIDCLRLAFTVKIFSGMENKYKKLPFVKRINRVLDELINKLGENSADDLWKTNALLKACIYKSRADALVTNKLLNNFKCFGHISSKNIENIYFCFLMTNSLIPEVIDNMTEYIVTYKNHVLGFNVSRVMYLCYSLGYQPKKSSEFFEKATNIIIRDQERMTGLSLIYTAVALCFFNKLPNSLIKSIFNEEFMDKLDSELEKCYSKDKYPQRVRYNLMELNRAVCLDYPESNVPWFHQKYVNENVHSTKNSLFSNKVREYLRKIVPTSALAENVVTAYGYKVDFVVNLNSREELVDESQAVKRLVFPHFRDRKITRVLSDMTEQEKQNVN
ncbi:FAST kinase domain-containing protein 1, mitochondrial isoform X2 [Tribolium madens]|uniref:FAST kinase domain-containing protein 1, mitochondrial isoform X2 n=1 Tax=Tribolium madens TaxID=41895 RepID=UPI001CF73613|nr:FAST kinase domain-containing protein 1, mitochondrial isoform X2 [Tribolium madens]